MDISQSNSTHSDWAAQLYPQGATSFTESSAIMASTTTSVQPVGGRPGRATRRRSRPSRRAPTTILNTDEANFRAMVQQFTGVPTRPMMPDYRPQSINGYVADLNQTQQQIGIHPFSNHPRQYEQFHQQYGRGYEQGTSGGAQIGGIGSGGFFL